MSNIILTTSGASFMNLAGPSGPYIPIKYFVPVYDHRYDTLVHPTSALIPVSAGDFTSANSPYGDIIWNVDSISTSSYSMSPVEYLIYDANQTGTSTIAGSSFDSTAFTTLRTGRPLSNTVSAISFVYNYPNWTVNGYTLVSGSNVVPTGYATTTGKFFNTVSYAPISSAAGGNSRGLFKVRLGNQVGNFKFNKIALYAAKMLADGSEDTSVAPVLFGIAMLKEPIIKSNDGFNISFFELDVELQFSSNGYFSNVSFLQNTEWNYVASQNSLWFDGRVMIGSSAVPGSWSPNSKFHIVEPNVAVPFTRFTDDNLVSYVDEYYSHTGTINSDSKISSFPASYYYFKTSGTTNYEESYFSLNALQFQRSLVLATHSTLSGDHYDGILSEYDGYLEKLNIYVDSQYLATFRSKLNTYGTLVLGRDSNSQYEDPTHFLTLYGGALLVGSNTLSGHATVTKNLIMNGASSTITFSDNSTHQISSLGALNIVSVNGMGLTTTTANIILSPGFTDSLVVTPGNVSALGVFNSTGTMNSLGLITGSNGLVISGSSYFYGTSINSYVQFSQFGTSFFHDKLTGISALFTNDVVVQNNLLVQNNVSANGGYWELGRTQANGRWIDFSPTFTATLGSITGVTITTARYSVIGKKLYIQLWAVMTCSNAGNPTVAFTIPGSFLAGPNAQRSSGMMMFPSGQGEILYADMNAGGSTISFNRLGNPVGAAYGAASFFMIGNISFEIQ